MIVIKSSNVKRRNKQLQKIIFHKYIYKRQTLDDLASEYKRSISWVQKQIFEYEPAYRSLKTNLPYLFTHRRYKQLGIQNTTNSLDGGVVLCDENVD